MLILLQRKDTVFEFSGKISSGKRIMGISFNDIISTILKADDSIYWDIPDTWSMQAAVTIPIPYLTVSIINIYSFHCIAVKLES